MYHLEVKKNDVLFTQMRAETVHFECDFFIYDSKGNQIHRANNKGRLATVGPITIEERQAILMKSDMAGKYHQSLDRRSAFEMLAQRADAAATEAARAEQNAEELDPVFREFNAGRRYSGPRVSRSTSRQSSSRDTLSSAVTEAIIKELKGTTGRRLVRGILGGLFKGR